MTDPKVPREVEEGDTVPPQPLESFIKKQKKWRELREQTDKIEENV